METKPNQKQIPFDTHLQIKLNGLNPVDIKK